MRTPRGVIITVECKIPPRRSQRILRYIRHAMFLLQVVCVTYMPLMAYTILLRDLLAPIVEIVLNRTLDIQARNIMVSALVALVRFLNDL